MEEVEANNTEQNTVPQQTKKKFSFFRLLKRLFIFIFSILLLFLASVFVIIHFYENDVKAYIIQELNKRLNAKVIIEPKDINLTIIKSFPYASLEFHNMIAMGTNPKLKNDTLLNAEMISLQFNVIDIFKKN